MATEWANLETSISNNYCVLYPPICYQGQPDMPKSSGEHETHGLKKVPS